MKVVIDVTRNELELTGGWDEENLARYLIRYLKAYADQMLKGDFPEYDFTVTEGDDPNRKC
ncbi:MAG TPA: hypothetical protein VGG75_13745 [Trebonia sp.]